MKPEVRPAVAVPRPPPGEAGVRAGPGSTVIRDGGGGRAGLAARSWGPGPTPADSLRLALPPVVHEFTAAWERGDEPDVADYLRRLDPADVQGAVDLIYRAFCLAESDGRAPDPDEFVARFPRHAGALRDLFDFHGACSPSLLGRLMGPPPDPGASAAGGLGPPPPEAGDSIGPYVLRRELGRGSFARVFLAEQADLANRLVVVKIATRATREPWLLARARHAHIVEILSHAEVDDGAYQLISMPFWGGATLAEVLAAPGSASDPQRSGSGPGSSATGGGPGRGGRLRRRGRDRGPTRGADLLSALDAVAAPEYPSVHPARPAREILAPLSYDRAIAWVVARLAEALDHASGRDVTHGDVKPSNILLSADGSPMLLDFNLARDGAPARDPSGRPIDPGGTLAYMAPERLRALSTAGAGQSSASSRYSAAPGGAEWSSAVEVDGESRDAWAAAGQSAHVADIYSMGMVLVEAITGRPPSEAAVPGRGDGGPAGLLAAARAYAEARERPASALVRDFEAASGRPIAPAMRAILARCLDPDPSRRYRRALELAEDLDRWRADRPLAYADEPFWGQAVPRWLRARRRMLIVAAASILALALATTAMVLVGSNRLLVRDLEATASAKLARKWDDPEAGAFLGGHRLSAPQLWEPDDAEALDVARRALLDYGIIGPGGVPTAAAADWRARDDVRFLSEADRDDLEAWLMERAYRYGRAMEGRPSSPVEWRQAIEILDSIGGPRAPRAFAPLRDRLAVKLGDAPGPGPSAAAPGWLDEHLLGFEAECQPEGESCDPRGAIERALGHYDRALAIRPGSFWAHYRAASACFAMGRESEAARHLSECLRRRPGSVGVREVLAGRLIALGQPAEALEHCDRALERAPGFAEVYRTRVLARASSGQTGGVDADLHHFEMFSRVLPPSYWGRADGSSSSGPFDALTGVGSPGRRARDEAIRADPDDVGARALVAESLRQAGLLPQAQAELDKILVIQPDHIPSRLMRAELAIADGRFDAGRADLAVALAAPRLEGYVRSYPGSLTPLFTMTRQLLNAGRVEGARRVADRARELAIEARRDLGKAHYHSALVYAVLGASEPDAIEEAARHLFRAAVANPEFVQWYRNPNPWFDPVRSRIDQALGRMEDPAAVRRRIAARKSAGVARP